MDGFKGVLKYFWESVDDDEDNSSSSSSSSLDVLAEAASKKRPRRKYQPRIVSKKGDLPVDLANKGIIRMLDITKVRFGIDVQRSVLHVFFDGGGAQKKRSRTSGRFEVREEEYPYLGDSVEELAQHIKVQEIPDICTLAATYPVGFWNAVYLIGKDLDDLREKLF
jgi:hypothetical protein